MELFNQDKKNTSWISLPAIIGIFVLLVLVIGGGLVGCPSYAVYSAEMTGKAELAQADQNRQIQIAQAKAHADAAQYEAQADITRAKGLAAANKIIGDSLAGPEGAAYIRWMWVQGLNDQKNQKTIVYVPTETNIPLMESTRLNPTTVH